MRRVIVIGCPGSGKSTFSKALHMKTGLPLFHLDMLYWNADGTAVNKTVFMERLSAALQKEAWIIDGNYASTMELRLQACDTVFFLDYPTEVCLEGALSRRGKARSDMPWVEDTNHVDEEFIRLIQSYASQSSPAVLKLLNEYPDKTVYIFKSRSEAEKFLCEIP